MTRRTCPRCAGAFYGICRKCEAPLTSRVCRNCGTERSADLPLVRAQPWERTTFFCPGGAAGPHVDTRIVCDCCATSLVFVRSYVSGAPVPSPGQWKKWSLAGGAEMDLCPDCFARLTAIISVSVDSLFAERGESMKNVRWLPPDQRVQYSPTRITFENSRRYLRLQNGRLQVAPAPDGPWRLAREGEEMEMRVKFSVQDIVALNSEDRDR